MRIRIAHNSRGNRKTDTLYIDGKKIASTRYFGGSKSEDAASDHIYLAAISAGFPANMWHEFMVHHATRGGEFEAK